METCTQRLQTFHQVKQYSGSLVKTQDLRLRDAKSFAHLVDFDPRPPKMRKTAEYQHTSILVFRNTMLNCQSPDARPSQFPFDISSHQRTSRQCATTMTISTKHRRAISWNISKCRPLATPTQRTSRRRLVVRDLYLSGDIDECS